MVCWPPDSRGDRRHGFSEVPSASGRYRKAGLLSEVSFAGRGGIQTAAIDPAGHWIALQTGYDQGGSTIIVMPIWPDRLEAEACRRVARNLSPTEVEAYLPGRTYSGTCAGLEQVSE
jgi:hypothetical protein